MSWEDSFKFWAKGPSDSEQDKADNAERIICEALNNDEKLSKMDIKVFAQGSYKAKTNVRLDSDVDICVLLKSSYFYDLSLSDLTEEQEPGTPGTITYQDFKNEVENALVRQFGRTQVARGKKAFDIHANTYRIDADVVPAFVHRRYLNGKNYNGAHNYEEGIAFIPDNGYRIENWPDHTFANGKLKDDQTRGRYKDVVRILKVLRNKMQEEGKPEATDMGSFLIESLVWNVPNSSFNNFRLEDDVKAVLNHTFGNTYEQKDCEEWGEVNERKYLFKPISTVRTKANDFLYAAHKHLGYL